MRFGTLLCVCAIAATDAVQFSPGRLGFNVVGGGDADDVEVMSVMEKAATEGQPEDLADISDQAFLQEMDQLYQENPTERVHVDYLSPAEPVLEETHRAKAMSLYSRGASSADVADDEDNLEDEEDEEEEEVEAKEAKLTKTKRRAAATLAQEVDSDANLGEAAAKVLSDTKADLVTVKNHMEALARQQSSLTHKMTARITRIIRDMNRTKDHKTSVDGHSAPKNVTAPSVTATEPLAVVASKTNGSRSLEAVHANSTMDVRGSVEKSNHSSADAAAKQGAEKSNHSADAAAEQNVSKDNHSAGALAEHSTGKSNHSVDIAAEGKTSKSKQSVAAVGAHNATPSNHSVGVAAENSTGRGNHSVDAVAGHSMSKINRSADAVTELHAVLNTSKINLSADAVTELHAVLNTSAANHSVDAVAEPSGSGNITVKVNQSTVMLVKNMSKPAINGTGSK